MQDKTRTDKVVVKKILDYCDDIEEAVREEFNFSYEVYLSKKFVRYGCDTCIFQIGELTKHLTADFKEKNSEIEWNQIKGLWNIYAHDYENLKLDKIWRTLTEDIPKLKEQLKKIFYEEA